MKFWNKNNSTRFAGHGIFSFRSFLEPLTKKFYAQSVNEQCMASWTSFMAKKNSFWPRTLTLYIKSLPSSTVTVLRSQTRISPLWSHKSCAGNSFRPFHPSVYLGALDSWFLLVTRVLDGRFCRAGLPGRVHVELGLACLGISSFSAQTYISLSSHC